MGLTPDQVDALARELDEAERTATAVEQLSARHPDVTLEDAYAVQLAGRALREARGARVIGRKVGLTSQAMQELLGVDEPDFGYLTDAMVHEDGADVDAGGLVAPRVEAEIAFRLDAPLEGAGADRAAALAATAAVAPALEVVDSRFADWRMRLADTVADNASSGLAVVGAFVPLGDLDLAAVQMTIEVTRADGTVESDAGGGDAVLGHPAEAVAWLARALAPFGERIEAGQVVIPGAMHRAVDLRAGDAVRADFGALGTVSATFGSAA